MLDFSGILYLSMLGSSVGAISSLSSEVAFATFSSSLLVISIFSDREEIKDLSGLTCENMGAGENLIGLTEGSKKVSLMYLEER